MKKKKLILKIVYSLLFSSTLIFSSYSAMADESLQNNDIQEVIVEQNIATLPDISEDSEVIIPEKYIEYVDVKTTLETNIFLDFKNDVFSISDDKEHTIKLFLKEKVDNSFIVTVKKNDHYYEYKLNIVTNQQSSMETTAQTTGTTTENTKESVDTNNIESSTVDSNNYLDSCSDVETTDTTSVNSNETNSTIEDTDSTTEQSSKIDNVSGSSDTVKQQSRSSKGISELIEEDKKNGWDNDRQVDSLNEFQLESGNNIQYGFATTKDIFETTIRVKDSSGNIVDYRDKENSGKYKGIRLYTKQANLLGMGNSLKEIPTIKIQQTSTKDAAIRGYGTTTISVNTVGTYVYDYKFLVEVTLTPNVDSQNVTVSYNFIRVDEPLIGDASPFNQEFYQLTDIELNHNIQGSAYYLGENKGLFFKDDNYQIQFGMIGNNHPDSWDVGSDTHIDWSIGVHWPIRPSNPSDFFPKGSGLESQNGEVNSFIGKYTSPTVALKWNSKKIRPNENREMSYNILLDSPVKPIIEVNHFNSLIEKDKNLELSGNIKNASKLYYKIDDSPISSSNTEGSENWKLNINVEEFKRGKHYITIFAQNKLGVSSEEIKLPFRIVTEEDHWIIDSEVKAINGDLNNLHLGDELEYTVTLETINLPLPEKVNWEYYISDYVEVIGNSANFKYRVDERQINVNNNSLNTGDFLMGTNDKAVLKFKVKIKENAYRKKPLDIVNMSNVKNSKDNVVIDDSYALIGTKNITHFPKLNADTVLRTNSGKDELKENDEFSLSTKVENRAEKYELKNDETGNLMNLTYTLPKLQGIEYSEIKIFKDGKEVDKDVASGELQTEEDSLRNGDSVLVQFKKAVVPQDKYEIKVIGKIVDADILSQKENLNILINAKSGGNENEQEVLATRNIVELPRIIPNGSLLIKKVNDSIDFGSLKKEKEIQKIYPKVLSIEIEDTRTESQNWSLNIHGNLNSVEDEKKSISLYYQNGEKSNPQSLSSGISISGVGGKNIDFQDKIYVEVLPQTPIGDYKGKIIWELKDTPE
ncbi:hypothetical protein E0T48_002703 [Enterococcus faecalis]|uniref:hypothetical protein n=1 Tax=Enterococcus faecalis TaxID=1351 RepID=UPI000CF6A92F|nr:hypothetical protein [Enterococcus faecalis]EGO5243401.1 hypothetical protein [Enterococcus faecalis]EHK9982425.1 hypothetical protein [Enterococcus faecalis]PQC11816.1 hypothetical protein CUM91_11890 [Enterococcus faecalis]